MFKCYVQCFLTQWSFGVTCWEVFTCGGVPYAGIPVASLLRELRSGHRLDRPSNISCSNDMYVLKHSSFITTWSISAFQNASTITTCFVPRWSVVTSCWSASPRERPNFATLVNSFSDLLDTDPTYIKLLV